MEKTKRRVLLRSDLKEMLRSDDAVIAQFASLALSEISWEPEAIGVRMPEYGLVPEIEFVWEGEQL